jgi:hypothetical protein
LFLGGTNSKPLLYIETGTLRDGYTYRCTHKDSKQLRPVFKQCDDDDDDDDDDKDDDEEEEEEEEEEKADDEDDDDDDDDDDDNNNDDDNNDDNDDNEISPPRLAHLLTRREAGVSKPD